MKYQCKHCGKELFLIKPAPTFGFTSDTEVYMHKYGGSFWYSCDVHGGIDGDIAELKQLNDYLNDFEKCLR